MTPRNHETSTKDIHSSPPNSPQPLVGARTGPFFLHSFLLSKNIEYSYRVSPAQSRELSEIHTLLACDPTNKNKTGVGKRPSGAAAFRRLIRNEMNNTSTVSRGLSEQQVLENR
ncbi:hypothetical protein AVEN_101728-1 [Araneus ventricosus]|uniref:Uncharacterized protein n=1 Tax=Araneus ventricosus TaxID=182803 RepID=A0A4Y2QED2_ARAVE|nr:hypothetical protein AVEN_101728-1 [Araneus ventricosus]